MTDERTALVPQKNSPTDTPRWHMFAKHGLIILILCIAAELFGFIIFAGQHYDECHEAKGATTPQSDGSCQDGSINVDHCCITNADAPAFRDEIATLKHNQHLVSAFLPAGIVVVYFLLVLIINWLKPSASSESTQSTSPAKGVVPLTSVLSHNSQLAGNTPPDSRNRSFTT